MVYFWHHQINVDGILESYPDWLTIDVLICNNWTHLMTHLGAKVLRMSVSSLNAIRSSVYSFFPHYKMSLIMSSSKHPYRENTNLLVGLCSQQGAAYAEK